MALAPATFYDDNGVVRLQGQLDGGGGTAVVSAAATNVTAAQLKALAGTGVTLVAAPGAGNALVPLGLFLQVKFGTAAFVNPGGADIVVVAGTDPFNAVIEYEFLTQGLVPASPGIDVFLYSTDAYWYTGAPVNQTLIPASEPVDNAPLTLLNFGANLTTGDGSARFVLYYATVALL